MLGDMMEKTPRWSIMVSHWGGVNELGCYGLVPRDVIPSRMLWRVAFERLTDGLSDEEAAKVRLRVFMCACALL